MVARIPSLPLRRRAAAPLALAVLFAWAAGASAQAPSAAPPPVLRLAIAQEPEHLDLHAYSTFHHALVAHLFAGTLLDRDATGAIVPAAVASWRRSSPTEWAFVLRPGVRFHDGSLLRAEDVAASLDRVSRINKKDFGTVASVRAEGELEFRIVTATPDPLLPARLVPLGFVVPKRAAEAAGGFEQYFAAGRVAGFGPYRLTRWEKGVAVELTAFADYYGGAPRIPAIRFVFEPDPDRRVAGLLAGEIDLAADLPAISSLQIQRSGKAAVVKGATSQYLFGNYRILDAASPLADPRVRKALNLALDRPRLIQLLELGNGTPVPTIFVREAEGYLDLPPRAYDAQAARRLLAEAGYAKGLRLRALVSADIAEIAKAIRRQLEEVGVLLEIEEIKRDEGILEWLVKGAKDQDLFLLNPVDPMIDVAYHVETLVARFPRQNLGVVERLKPLFAASNAATETAARRASLAEIQRTIYDEDLYLFLWQRLGVYGVSSRLRGFKPYIDGMIRLEGARLE